jgi:hypothetical protein
VVRGAAVGTEVMTFMKSCPVANMREKVLPFVLRVLYCPKADWTLPIGVDKRSVAFEMASQAETVDLMGQMPNRR